MAKRKQKTANTQRWRGFRAPSIPTQLLAEVQTGMVWPPWTSTWQRPQKLTWRFHPGRLCSKTCPRTWWRDAPYHPVKNWARQVSIHRTWGGTSAQLRTTQNERKWMLLPYGNNLAEAQRGAKKARCRGVCYMTTFTWSSRKRNTRLWWKKLKQWLPLQGRDTTEPSGDQVTPCPGYGRECPLCAHHYTLDFSNQLSAHPSPLEPLWNSPSPERPEHLQATSDGKLGLSVICTSPPTTLERVVASSWPSCPKAGHY